jgi:hypothetical protein
MLSVLEGLTENEKTCLTKIQGACGDGFVNGVVYHNFDAGEISGLATVLKKKAPVNPDLIQKNTFQYFAIVPVDTELNKHVTGDAYFTERRAELDEAIPQYGARAPPSLSCRSRVNDNDTCVTDVELGQYGGRVGIYKQIDETNGEDTRHFLVAVGGAQKACDDLKRYVNERHDAIDKWGGDGEPEPFTNEELILNPECNYVEHVAQCNVKRMLYHAADALGIAITSVPYYNVDLDVTKMSYPSLGIPEHIQTISGMDSYATPKGEVLNVFRDVIPSSELRQNQPFYVMEGPADPIHVFDVGFSSMPSGAPATTGRAKPLPDNVKDIQIAAEMVGDYERRLKKVFYEGDNIHPEVAPDAYNRIQSKGDRSFIEGLTKWGWNKDNTHERLYPVCVKISNPFLQRPRTTTPSPSQGERSPQTQNMIKDEFNE